MIIACRLRSPAPFLFLGALIFAVTVIQVTASSSKKPAGETRTLVGQSTEPYVLRSMVKGDEFSISMPSQPTALVSHLDYLFKTDGEVVKEERTFSSYASGVVFMVRVLITSNGKQAFAEYLAAKMSYKETRHAVTNSEVVLGGFRGKQEEVLGTSVSYQEKFYRKSQYFATKHNIYIVSATARDANNPSISSYFSSLKLGDMASNTAVKNSPAPGVPAMARDRSAQRGTVQVLQPEEVTRKAIIVWEPDPGIDEEIVHANTPIFKIKLQMLLSLGGEVTEVKVLAGWKPDINEKVMNIAKYTRFIPAEKDGQPVSQWHLVEYVFGR